MPSSLKPVMDNIPVNQDDPVRRIISVTGKQMQVIFTNKMLPNSETFFGNDPAITIATAVTGIKGLMFDAGQDANGVPFSYRGEKETGTAAQLFTAALVALSKKTVEWLRRHDDRIQVESRDALSALDLVIHVLAQGIRSEQLTGSAA